MNICTGVVTGYGKPERTEALTEISTAEVFGVSKTPTIRSNGRGQDLQFAFIFPRSTASPGESTLAHFAPSPSFATSIGVSFWSLIPAARGSPLRSHRIATQLLV